MDDKVGRPRTNSEIRRWYLDRIARVVDLNEAWIRRGFSARDRAERARRIRREARLAARAMMVEKRERELLRARDVLEYGSPDGPSLEFLIARLRDAGLERDDAFEAIIAVSSKTDSELNRLLGM